MIRRRSQRPPKIGWGICALISCIYLGTGFSPLCLLARRAIKASAIPWHGRPRAGPSRSGEPSTVRIEFFSAHQLGPTDRSTSWDQRFYLRCFRTKLSGPLLSAHSASFDHRRLPETFRTAIAMAFFCPTNTTRLLPRGLDFLAGRHQVLAPSSGWASRRKGCGLLRL